MISYPVAFATEHNKAHRSPRWVVRVWFDDAKTASFDLTSHSDFTTSATTEFQGVLSVSPNGTSQTYNPDDGSSTIGSLTIRLADPGNLIADHIQTQIAAGTGLRWKPADVWLGYRGMAFSDFQQVAGLVITDIQWTGTEYTIKLEDRQREMRADILEPQKSTLTQTITAGATNPGQTAIPITSTAATIFEVVEHDTGYTDSPAIVTTACSVTVAAGTATFALSSGPFPTMVVGQTVRFSGFTTAGNNASFVIVTYATNSITAAAGSAATEAAGDTVTVWPRYGYVKIEDEIVKHAGVYTDATYGKSLRVVSRGAFGTSAVAHEVDAAASTSRRTPVEEYITIDGPAVKQMYAIQTGVLYDQGGQTLPDHWHLGISTSFVKLADYTGIGADWWDTTDNDAGRKLRFLGIGRQDGKRFLEREYCLWLGARMPVYSDGTIGLRRLTRVSPVAGGVVTFNRDNTSSIDSMQYAMHAVVNRVTVEWNWRDDDTESGYTQTRQFIDAESVSANKLSPPKAFAFRGAHTSAQTDRDLADFFEYRRARYADPPWLVKVTCSMRMSGVEIGDPVQVQFPEIYDLASGDTLDRTFEVLGITPNYGNGTISYDLIGSTSDPTPIDHGDNATRLNTAFYTAHGTELEAYLDATFGAGTYIDGAGNLQQDITLASGRYYYIGDFALNGFTINITGTVWLAIQGEVDLGSSGGVDGSGQGKAGGTATSNYSDYFGIAGTAGYFGVTHGAGGIFGVPIEKRGPYSFFAQAQTVGQHATALPLMSLENPDGNSLSGIDLDMDGSGGSSGASVAHLLATGGVVLAAGGNGGAGGAGFGLICRGFVDPAGATINLSGADGSLGSSTTEYVGPFLFVEPRTKYAGSGAGGAPGAFRLVMDGNFTMPTKGSWLVQQFGTSPVPTGSQPLADVKNIRDAIARSDVWVPQSGVEARDAASMFQFAPDPLVPEEEDPRPLFLHRMVKRFTGSAAVTSGGVTMGGGSLTGATVETTAGTSAQTVRFNPSTNELEFYGDRGDGTIAKLATIGITNDGSDDIILLLGALGSGYSNTAAKFYANNANPTALFGSTDGIGAYATSANAQGLFASGGTYGASFVGDGKGPLRLVPSSGATASAPTHSALGGTLWVTTAYVLYINTTAAGEGATWAKVGAQ